MDELLESLRAWGADTEGALSIMAGDRGFYFEKLREFRDSGEINELSDLIGRGQYEAAFRVAHDLKGVTATLGLLPLYRSVSQVVEDVRFEPQPGVEKDLAAFLEEMERFREIINNGE